MSKSNEESLTPPPYEVPTLAIRQYRSGTVGSLTVFGAGANSAMLEAYFNPDGRDGLNEPFSVAAFPFEGTTTVAGIGDVEQKKALSASTPGPSIYGTHPAVFNGFVEMLSKAFVSRTQVRIEYDGYVGVGNFLRRVSFGT